MFLNRHTENYTMPSNRGTHRRRRVSPASALPRRLHSSTGTTAASRKCYVVAILMLLALLMVLFLSVVNQSLGYYYTPQKRTATGYGNTTLEASAAAAVQQQHKTHFYSIARLDQSGSVIHDMLLAHAYAYDQGGVYGGACLHYLPFYPRRDCVRLLRDLQWDAALAFRCPSSSSLSWLSLFSRAQDDDAVFVPQKTYRDLDATLFTPEWRASFLEQIQAATTTRRKKRYNSITSAARDEHDTESVFSIAVHIRRGDVNPCHYPTRYLPNNHYLRLIQRYTPANHSNVQVTIFSEGKSYEPFSSFSDQNDLSSSNNSSSTYFTLALDSSLAAVWKALETADVAILSKSSFSYVPAVLNTRTVVYTDFWHGAVAGWETVSADMLEQTAAEAKQLQEEACRVIPPRRRGVWKRYGLPWLRKILMQPKA